MNLSFSEKTGFFSFSCSYDEKDYPKSAGFIWNKAQRVWQTNDLNKAYGLAKFADHHAAQKLGGKIAERFEAIEASRAANCDIDIPCPAGLAYLPYQKAGIAYAMARKNCMIADEMGLGKTVQAIGTVNAMKLLFGARILILVPASLKLNWQREWQRWCVESIHTRIVTDTWPRIISDGALFGDGVAAIMSYEAVKKHKAEIDKVEWDILICDEAHVLKNSATMRSKVVLGDSKKPVNGIQPIRAHRTLMLTGTPIVNRPSEMWPFIRRLDPTGLGKSHKDYDLMVSQGRSRHIQDSMRAAFMVRRLKADVLKELPDKMRQIVLLNVDDAESIGRRERDILAKKRDELLELEAEFAVDKLKQWRGAAMSEMALIRHETALLKLPAAIEHIRGVMEEQSKVILFAHHHDIIDGLESALAEFHPVKVDGRQTDKDRDFAVVSFQNDPSRRIFIGSIRAAGLGLTLTASSTVIFVEQDWTPAAMSQAEDRAHRIGQKDCVTVQILVIDGTIDCLMARIILNKQVMIAASLDGDAPTIAGRSVIDELVRGE